MATTITDRQREADNFMNNQLLVLERLLIGAEYLGMNEMADRIREAIQMGEAGQGIYQSVISDLVYKQYQQSVEASNNMVNAALAAVTHIERSAK